MNTLQKTILFFLITFINSVTSDTREVPSVAPELGTIVNKTKSKNIVNKTKGSVREACEETTLLKLKIYNKNIIEAVRIYIIIFLMIVKCCC